MINPNMMGKIIQMFQTTNQISNYGSIHVARKLLKLRRPKLPTLGNTLEIWYPLVT